MVSTKSKGKMMFIGTNVMFYHFWLGTKMTTSKVLLISFMFGVPTFPKNQFKSLITDVEKKLKKKLLIDYLYSNLKHHNFWAYRYFFCEFLALLNVSGANRKVSRRKKRKIKGGAEKRIKSYPNRLIFMEDHIPIRLDRNLH